jgi:hypothetical protein
MDNIEDLFLKPELTQTIIAKGYNQIPLAHYVKEVNQSWMLYREGGTFLTRDYNYHMIAPMYDQVVNWFATKGIEINTTSWIKRGTKNEIVWYYSLEKIGKPSTYNCVEYDTRYLALDKAFDEALKLI